MNTIDIIIISAVAISMVIGLLVGAKKGMGNTIIVCSALDVGILAAKLLLNWVKDWKYYPAWLEQCGGNETNLTLLISSLIFAIAAVCSWVPLKIFFTVLGMNREGTGNHVCGLLLGAFLILNLTISTAVIVFALRDNLPQVNVALGNPSGFFADSLIFKGIENIFSRGQNS
jgi:uncharacterized membrane protein required for colicin V production